MKAMETAIFKVVKTILEKNNGDIQNTCEELGITRRTLTNYRLKWPELEDMIVYRSNEDESTGNEKWKRLEK